MIRLKKMTLFLFLLLGATFAESANATSSTYTQFSNHVKSIIYSKCGCPISATVVPPHAGKASGGISTSASYMAMLVDAETGLVEVCSHSSGKRLMCQNVKQLTFDCSGRTLTTQYKSTGGTLNVAIKALNNNATGAARYQNRHQIKTSVTQALVSSGSAQ